MQLHQNLYTMNSHIRNSKIAAGVLCIILQRTTKATEKYSFYRANLNSYHRTTGSSTNDNPMTPSKATLPIKKRARRPKYLWSKRLTKLQLQHTDLKRIKKEKIPINMRVHTAEWRDLENLKKIVKFRLEAQMREVRN